MKKKLLFILLFPLFLTGCSTNYYMEIYNDKINEEYTINFGSDEVGNLTPLNYANQTLYDYFGNCDDIGMRKFKNMSEGYGIQSSNSYNYKEFKSNLIGIKQCYNVVDFAYNTKYIAIATTNQFKCYEIFENMEKLTINIKSNHKMIENNADSVKNNTYTWNISKYNADNKPIKIKFSKDKYVFNYNGEFTKKVIYIAVISGIILSVGLSIRGYFKHKSKLANKI